jgi:ComEC/Rec2-related protein
MALALPVAAFTASVSLKPSSVSDVRQLPDTKFGLETEWRGRVDSFPESSSGGVQSFLFRMEGWREGGGTDWFPAVGLVRASVREQALVHWGESIVLRGGLERFAASTNPGQLDRVAYESIHGIYFRLPARALFFSKTAPWTFSFLEHSRGWALRQMALGLEDDAQSCGLLAGMLIGSKEDISQDLQAAFRTTGAYHIFAVSGQNVGMLLAVVILGLQTVGLTRWRWSWLTAPLLLGYCLITGAQASAVRALLMALAVILAWRLSRPVNPLNLWAAALLGLLVSSPQMVLDLGFQLSFAVVLALLLLSPPLFRWMFQPWRIDPWIPPRLVSETRRRLERVAHHFIMLVSASLAAWLGSLPWSLLVFHQISWIAVIANLWVVPLAGMIVVVGSLSLGVSLVSSSLAVVLNNANWFFLRLLVAGTVQLSHVPGAVTTVGSWQAWRPAGTTEVWFLDGSRVPLAIVRTDAGTVVLNPGSARDFPYGMSATAKWLGVQRVHSVIVSQMSGLHAGAGPLACQAWRPDHWIVPPGKTHAPFLKAWLQDFSDRRVPKEFWWQGSKETLSPGVILTCLWPASEVSPVRAEDRGLVFRLEAHGHRLLWAGAVSDDVEHELLREGLDLRAEVLLEHEHSSVPNLTPDWLRAVRPRHWIHPRRSFSQQRANRDPLQDLRPDERPQNWNLAETGAVRIRISPSGVDVQSWLGQVPSAPWTGWGEEDTISPP